MGVHADDIAWLPIATADRSIAVVMPVPGTSITMRHSYPIWARTEGGEHREVSWCQRNADGSEGYWWDWDAEDVCEPDEWCPHPLAPDDNADRCMACLTAFVDGDEVYADVSGGTLHARCAGTDREGFVGADEQPLKDGEPIPKPYLWHPTDPPAPATDDWKAIAALQSRRCAIAVSALLKAEQHIATRSGNGETELRAELQKAISLATGKVDGDGQLSGTNRSYEDMLP